MKQIAVIGAGSWGTALGIIAGRAGHHVRLWARNSDVVNEINSHHINSSYLKSFTIPESTWATEEFAEALPGAEFVLLASPSHATRELLIRMLPFLEPQMIFVSATKGIEIETGKRVSQIVNEIVGERFVPHFVCLSGPSFALEVVTGQPTAIVAASVNQEDGVLIQRELSFDNLRIYTNSDVVGTEIGGAVKNIMAIAAGIVSGLGLGANSIAALITRGLSEVARLALAQGARHETLMGLAGLGDLVLTCTGHLSRNRHVGVELGKGRPLDKIVEQMHEVAEGIKTTLAVKKLAEQLSLDMPITNEVYDVMYEGKSALDAASELMNRPLRGEF